MNKQQLASNIWSTANYKDYMLGFIFYKYLSNKEEEYLKKRLRYSDDDLKNLTWEEESTVSNCQKNLGYFIQFDDLFSAWINKGTDFEIKNVTDALSNLDISISDNYKKVYDGIFDTLRNGLTDLGKNTGDQTKNARKLIKIINKIPVEGKENYDVLGFIYEFLLKNFAANAGKVGEFYTPYEASVIMSEIIAHHLKDKEEISIYDPTSGSASSLLNIGKSVSKHLNNPDKVRYYAQELIPDTYNLTRMNLVMRDDLPDNIITRQGDSLEDDWPFFEDEKRKESTYQLVEVDACSSNPPYSQNWSPEGKDVDPRFSDFNGLAPKTKADYAFEAASEKGYKINSIDGDKAYKNTYRYTIKRRNIHLSDEGIDAEVIDILDYGNVRFGKVRTKNNELLINVDKDFDKKNVHLSFDSNDLYVYSTDVDMRSC